MVENYPTCLKVLLLGENDISLELQQQICDLLSEGEEDDNRESTPTQRDAASSCALSAIKDKYQPPSWQTHSSKG